MQPEDGQDCWYGAENARHESGCSGGTTKHGERRGSAGAFRPVSIEESRDSIQTESTPQKPLRDSVQFDLTQPWQRSLLRDLEQIETSILEENLDSRPRPQADRVLLGHSESGDYLLECEDDISTATDASSTCPTRLQVVHRYQFPMRTRFHSRDESPETDPFKFRDIRHSPKGVHDEISVSLEKARHAPSYPARPYLSHPKLDSNDGFRPIPHALPSGRKFSCEPVSSELYRTNAFSEEIKPTEASRTLMEEDVDYMDPACMCMGYSSLIDLLLFNDQLTGRKKKRRTSAWESPPLSRRTSLNRVDEEEEDVTLDSGLNPYNTPAERIHSFQQAKDLELYEQDLY